MAFTHQGGRFSGQTWAPQWSERTQLTKIPTRPWLWNATYDARVVSDLATLIFRWCETIFIILGCAGKIFLTWKPPILNVTMFVDCQCSYSTVKSQGIGKKRKKKSTLCDKPPTVRPMINMCLFFGAVFKVPCINFNMSDTQNAILRVLYCRHLCLVNSPPFNATSSSCSAFERSFWAYFKARSWKI